MKLNDFITPAVIAQAKILDRRGGGNPEITGLEYDSRRIKPGNLYFALPGLHADGHAFIADAIGRGAAAVILEAPLSACPGMPADGSGVVFLRSTDSRFAMSPVSAAFYGFPSEKLILAGVTGTEGKSTTVYLIWQLLRLAGKKAGFISTVQYSPGDEARWNSEHQTTPEATTIHKQLAEMIACGAEYAVIEASSHGLSPRTNRLGDVSFDAAVMTNVTHEHLEFHGTWEQYRNDKANLFRSLDKRAARRDHTKNDSFKTFGVINAADKSTGFFASATKQKIFTFSSAPPEDAAGSGSAPPEDAAADLQLLSIESGAGGSRYRAVLSGKICGGTGKAFTIEDRLPGAFNAGNVLAALLAVSGLTGKSVESLVPLVPSLEPVRGRMTPVNKGQSFEILVDYAHTPSSFETIFPPLRSRLGGRIISLFGSGGERDTKKRPQQGAVAARFSDVVILTDEDPRGEEPLSILEEIAAGIPQAGTVESGAVGSKTVEGTGKLFRRGENLFLIPERPSAIRKAFSLARPGDVVLLLGKGHENSIIYRDHTIKYDEITEAETALEELFKTGSSAVRQNR